MDEKKITALEKYYVGQYVTFNSKLTEPRSINPRWKFYDKIRNNSMLFGIVRNIYSTELAVEWHVKYNDGKSTVFKTSHTASIPGIVPVQDIYSLKEIYKHIESKRKERERQC